MENKGVSPADGMEVKWDDPQGHWIGPLTRVAPAEVKSGGRAIRNLVVRGRQAVKKGAHRVKGGFVFYVGKAGAF